MTEYELEIVKLAARCKVLERATALALSGMVASRPDPSKIFSSFESHLRGFVAELPEEPLEAREDAEQTVDRLLRPADAVLHGR